MQGRPPTHVHDVTWLPGQKQLQVLLASHELQSGPCPGHWHSGCASVVVQDPEGQLVQVVEQGVPVPSQSASCVHGVLIMGCGGGNGW